MQWLSVFVTRKFCRPYISINCIFRKRGLIMETLIMMTGKTFVKAELAAMAVGAMAMGGLVWLCNKWDENYRSARDAGAVM